MGTYFRFHCVGTVAASRKELEVGLDRVRAVAARYSKESGGDLVLEELSSADAVDATLKIRAEATDGLMHAVSLSYRKASDGDWHLLGSQTNELHPLLYLPLYDVFDDLLRRSVTLFLYHERLYPETKWIVPHRGTGVETEYKGPGELTIASYDRFTKLRGEVAVVYGDPSSLASWQQRAARSEDVILSFGAPDDVPGFLAQSKDVVRKAAQALRQPGVLGELPTPRLRVLRVETRKSPWRGAGLSLLEEGLKGFREEEAPWVDEIDVYYLDTRDEQHCLRILFDRTKEAR